MEYDFVLSTLYIIVSFIHYWFDDYPMHKHFKEQPEYQKMALSQILSEKSLQRMDKILFFIATLNMAVCCVLILLKCIGILEWW